MRFLYLCKILFNFNSNLNSMSINNINSLIKNNNNIDYLTSSIEDINTINKEETKNKSLDTFFGISEKPPSPINSIDSYENTDYEEIDFNTKLSLSEIKNRIENLYETELFEIFKIINDNNEKYTTNNNGIFINISNLKSITINEITHFLIFSEKNNKLIDQEESERDLYREIVS
mgnify:CR=1 FL=1|jgi:hypothetical protein